MMHLKGGLHQKHLLLLQKRELAWVHSAVLPLKKAQLQLRGKENQFFYLQFTITGWAWWMFWTEESERRLCDPRWLKQLSWAEFVYSEKKWGRLQPTNPSAFYCWQTDALIRHDSFATGSKSSAVKLASCRMLLKKLPNIWAIATTILAIFSFFSLPIPRTSMWCDGNTKGFAGTLRRIKKIVAVKWRMLTNVFAGWGHGGFGGHFDIVDAE